MSKKNKATKSVARNNAAQLLAAATTPAIVSEGLAVSATVSADAAEDAVILGPVVLVEVTPPNAEPTVEAASDEASVQALLLEHAASVVPEEPVSDTVVVDSATQVVGALLKVKAQNVELEVSLIDASAFNPRKDFVQERLQELADNIAQHGVQSNILVRPKADGRYEIVFGERRWRAACMAGLKTIPSKVAELDDEQAENCAIIENMQRENLTPFEEGEIFCRKVEKGMSVQGLCLLFGKSERYVRTRMNLTRLIPPVAELLRKKEISIEMAKEFANYDQPIQEDVYAQHFADADSYNSWKGISAKEFSQRLYERYMTKLDIYHFDKTACGVCEHNTQGQVLFALCGECAGCQNPTCLEQKNEAYLVARCQELLRLDARTHIACTSQSNQNVVKQLTELGHEVMELERPLWNYRKGPQMPEPPKADEFEDADDLEIAKEDYQAEVARFKEACAELEFAVSEGKMLKYAIIGTRDIELRYDEARERQVTEKGVTYTREPEEPAKELKAKDRRNHQICHEHITVDLKKVLRSPNEAFPATNLRPRERQLFYYVLMDRLTYTHKQLLGVADDDTKRLELAERLTPEQKTMLLRMTVLRYLDDLRECNCEPGSTDIKVMTEFSKMHFPAQTEEVLKRHRGIYDKRHHNLAVRIQAIQKQAEVLRVQEMFEAGELWMMADGNVVNLKTGEVIDEELIQTALPDAEFLEVPGEEPLPCDEPEPVVPYIPSQEQDDEPAPDSREFIPEQNEEPAIITLAQKKPRAKTKAKTEGKRVALTSAEQKIAA